MAHKDSVLEKDVSSPPPDLFEVAGMIKWFDVSKGYGFVIPDNGMADLLLHGTCLRRCGYQTAYEGSRIVCEAALTERGYQVWSILSMDESTALCPISKSTKQRSRVEPTSDWVGARVKWFNRLRGFGFLSENENEPDMFIHMETLKDCRMTELQPGQEVQVRYGEREQGRMAVEIRPRLAH